MKKFILGLSYGVLLSFSTVIYASDSIQAVLFPSKFIFNGQAKELNSEYVVLNYKDHAYVPVRFVAEGLGASVGYQGDKKTISITMNELQKNITFVKNNIKKGISKDTLKGIMGKNYSEVTSDGPYGLLWRYDLSAVPGYKFEVPNDTMDIDGMKNKRLTAELFVQWNEDGTLKNYEMIYLSMDQENSIVRLNADGVEKVDPFGYK